ncbi:MAG: HAMP domain-containing histidine kinase [Anaerolineae bacterium]|nr:HAMP domain-containing histidine kinase [Anaerolineae bacterium]
MRRNPRLRARLFYSYLVLVIALLLVMTAAFLVFLFAQPVSATPTYERLLTTMQDIVQEVGLSARPTLVELTGLFKQLPQLASENETRILVINLPKQMVISDSAGTFTRGDSTHIVEESFTLRTPRRLTGQTVFGQIDDKDGSRWLFAGVAGIRQGQEANAIVLVDRPEVQTWQNVLDRFRRELALPLAQAALVGLVVAAGLAAIISRTLTRSLGQLVQVAESVAAGHYDQRVPEEGPAEIKSLAEAFNRMSSEVQSTQQSQKDFMANVGHDLKTPLTSIQGYSQAIMDGAAKDPTSAAKIIHEEAGRLNRMVTELTDLARLQAGRLSMRSSSIDMGKLAQAVGDRLSILARDKGLTLHVEADKVPEVAGDGDRLAQVLTNLVSNAIKYTPSGGEIWLRTQVNNGGVEVMVRDTGLGIKADDLPRIFERFYQVDKARGPRRGTGLGLAITQEIVQAHGGRITVTSAGEGEGSTFTVWLPSPQLTTIVRGRRSV